MILATRLSTLLTSAYHLYRRKTIPLSPTASALRTNVPPFARCTLGLNHHSPAIFNMIYYGITARMTKSFTSGKLLTMVNFQKLDLLLFFYELSVGISPTGLHPIMRESQRVPDEISSGLARIKIINI